MSCVLTYNTTSTQMLLLLVHSQCILEKSLQVKVVTKGAGLALHLESFGEPRLQHSPLPSLHLSPQGFQLCPVFRFRTRWLQVSLGLPVCTAVFVIVAITVTSISRVRPIQALAPNPSHTFI